MSTSLVHRFVVARQAKPGPLTARADLRIRRIFDNLQLIERFGKWLLICGKSENTRKAYAEAVRQFATFISKPLATATKEDVRAFIGNLYAKALAPTTIQVRLDALRVFGDCLLLGGQVRACAARFIF